MATRETHTGPVTGGPEAGAEAPPSDAGVVVPDTIAYSATKRAMDLVVGSVGLILSLPILILVATAIVIADGFPVFFRHRRIGRDGKEFWVYKIRSMRRDADAVLRQNLKLRQEFEQQFKLTKDPRVIPGVGEFIRKTSIDELPQFLNVLQGHMSLVGPRPVVRKELETLYGENAKFYLAVKPGCAGLWQCSGRSDLDYAKRVELDIEYVKGRSILMDIGILAKTFIAILLSKGAH